MARRGEDRLGQLLDAGIDTPSDGDSGEQALPGALKLTAEQVPRDDAEKDDDDEREEHSEEGDGRRILDTGQDELDDARQQQIVEPDDDRGDRPNRDADRCEEENSSDEITPDGFAQECEKASSHGFRSTSSGCLRVAHCIGYHGAQIDARASRA